MHYWKKLKKLKSKTHLMPTINERLITLFTALCFDTDNNKKVLTPGIRICINQERAYLMQLDYYEKFEQSQIVEEKINFITDQLRLRGETRMYNDYARAQLEQD